LFSSKKFSQKILNEFLSAIPDQFKFIEINLNTNCQFDSLNFQMRKKVTHHLSLNDNYENIFQGFNQNTKRNIRKAEKAELTFSKNGNAKSLISLFKSGVGKKTDLKSKDYKMLEALMTAAQKNNCGEVFSLNNRKGETEAALFLLSSENILINLFNASSDTGKKNSAMFQLMNEIIILNAESKKTLDFEGSEIPEVTIFYKGFGSSPVYYPSIKLNRLHWSLKWLKD
ncbi:MAG: hypothetical protein WCI97_08345, partial [Bacteroidota bacterium]